jgi:hypothetical protein
MSAFTLAFLSDIHYDHHHPIAVALAKKVCADVKPDITAWVGDIADFEALSKYKLGKEAQLKAIDQIKMAVSEVNGCMRAWGGKHILMPGNHEDRWESIFGNYTPFLRGAKGLSLEDQFRSQGLNPKVKWVSESVDCPGFLLPGPRLLLRHGHKQGNGYGVKNVAAAELSRFPSYRTIVGHHHRAQMMFHTELGNDSWAVTSPHLSGDHAYNITPNWQRGFVLVKLWGGRTPATCKYAVPSFALYDEKAEAMVAYGKVYTL